MLTLDQKRQIREIVEAYDADYDSLRTDYHNGEMNGDEFNFRANSLKVNKDADIEFIKNESAFT